MTPEARDAIENYLAWREGKDKTGPGGSYAESNLLFPYHPNTTREYLKTAKGKAGIEDKRDADTERRKLHQYSARKFFNSKSGLDDDIRHRLMGHSAYLSDSYSREEEEEDAEEYKETAIAPLTIFQENIGGPNHLKAGFLERLNKLKDREDREDVKDIVLKEENLDSLDELGNLGTPSYMEAMQILDDEIEERKGPEIIKFKESETGEEEEELLMSEEWIIDKKIEINEDTLIQLRKE